MFALEINFNDGVSHPETIFIRRPQALIGASDYAHVVVEDMRELDYQIRLVRDLGRKFRCKPVMARAEATPPVFSDDVFDGAATLELGKVRLHITAIDCDLLLKENEAPDRAGVRVLRQAYRAPSPMFPAVVVRGAQPLIMSFIPEQPIYIGRSKQCALRLDSADISARHARMGFENGEFWVEDLGSTNGTFVNNQQISGRVNVGAGVPIVLGREISVFGVTAEEQIGRTVQAPSLVTRRPEQEPVSFPALVSLSQVARPARLLLRPGTKVNIGRDPASDMWLGAPHISRLHCAVTMTDTGSLAVSDHSTNGTAYDGGVLRKGDLLSVGSTPRVFDFGGSVTVALCFTPAEEEMFRSAQGSVRSFSPQPEEGALKPLAEPAARPRTSTAAVPPAELSRVRSGGALNRLSELYKSGGVVARLGMIAVVAVLAVVLVVVVNLLIPVFG